MSIASQRLMKDFQRLQKENDEGIMASPQENNLMLWTATIFGPT